MDAYYTAAPFLKHVQGLGIPILGRVRSNRCFYLPPRRGFGCPAARGRKIKLNDAGMLSPNSKYTKMGNEYCFLCQPKKEWVYAKNENFFSMLGLGPIVEGYSLLATIGHTPSMLDLPLPAVKDLYDFTHHVRDVLRPHYGEAIITEHGRVAPCVDRDRGGQESHCFHAHRLIFPMDADLKESFVQHRLEVEEYSNFIECWKRFSWKGEYLYYERVDGTCLIAAAPLRLVRQFFRHKIANMIGCPDISSWSDYPRHKVVEAAIKRLFHVGE